MELLHCNSWRVGKVKGVERRAGVRTGDDWDTWGMVWKRRKVAGAVEAEEEDGKQRSTDRRWRATKRSRWGEMLVSSLIPHWDLLVRSHREINDPRHYHNAPSSPPSLCLSISAPTKHPPPSLIPTGHLSADRLHMHTDTRWSHAAPGRCENSLFSSSCFHCSHSTFCSLASPSYTPILLLSPLPLSHSLPPISYLLRSYFTLHLSLFRFPLLPSLLLAPALHVPRPGHLMHLSFVNVKVQP